MKIILPDQSTLLGTSIIVCDSCPTETRAQGQDRDANGVPTARHWIGCETEGWRESVFGACNFGLPTQDRTLSAKHFPPNGE